MMDTYVVCGDIVPEGRQICPKCELKGPKEILHIHKYDKKCPACGCNDGEILFLKLGDEGGVVTARACIRCGVLRLDKSHYSHVLKRYFTSFCEQINAELDWRYERKGGL